MNNFNLEKLQNIELNMLEQFINICNKENLQYYVVGGTLLGAVRHKGFIPWDDDIDVSMPRQDYEKFLVVAQKYLPKHLFLQTYITDEEIPWNYAKIRNSNTTFIQIYSNRSNINHGVFIDIFPLDYFNTSKIKLSLFNFYNTILKLEIVTTRYISNKKRSIYKQTIRKFISIILNFFFPNVMYRRDKLFKSVKESCLVTNYSGAWGNREVTPIEWFGKGTELKFENLIVKAPIEYKKYLTQIYGNYMQLPPKEKQIPRHDTDIIDLENSYTKYTKEEIKE